MTKPAVIQVDHVYAHQPSAIWRALTDPVLHARWWAAGDVRPIVGHRFELDSPMSRQAFEGMKPGWPQVLIRLEVALGA